MLTLSTIKYTEFVPASKKAPLQKATPYHRGNLREAILEISLQLIAEKGVRSLTLREIGNRLGVSRMAPYRHFADKEALLAAIAITGFREFADVLDSARKSSPASYSSQLDAMGLAYVRFATRHRAHFEVMFGAGGDAMHVDAEGLREANRAFEILEETISKGQRAKEFIEGETVQIARMVWALVHGISLLNFGSTDDESSTESFVKFCTYRLRAGLQRR
jgi:AcrR family transcriptional regulator